MVELARRNPNPTAEPVKKAINPSNLFSGNFGTVQRPTDTIASNSVGKSEPQAKNITEASQDPLKDFPLSAITANVSLNHIPIINLMVKTTRENRDITPEEWQSLDQSKTPKEARYAAVRDMGNIRKRIIGRFGWTIEIVGSKRGSGGKEGKPVFRKIANQEYIPLPRKRKAKPQAEPQTEPQVKTQEKLKTVTVFDGTKIVVKPAGLKTPTIRRLPENNRKTDFDDDTLDLIRKETLPKIGDAISKAMLELIIDAARRNETPKKEDLEKLFEQSGIKDRREIWQLMRQYSGIIRPALKELGLNIEPIDSETGAKIEEPIRISFRLMKIKPPNSKLLFSIEEIESAPIINDPAQQNKEKITSEIWKEDSPELAALKIDLTLSVLGLLSLSKLDMLDKNPYKLLNKFFREKEIRDIAGGRKKEEYVKFLVSSIIETAVRLMGATSKEEKKEEEEGKDKKIFTEKEKQVADILNELIRKGYRISRIEKAIFKHFGIGAEQNPTSSPEPESPEDEDPSSTPPKRKWSKYI